MFPEHLRIKTAASALASIALVLCGHLSGAGAAAARLGNSSNIAAIHTAATDTGGSNTAAIDDAVANDAAIPASICPIVVPLDAFPSEHGQRYLFYGNAFFINDDGYLITAAHVVSAFRREGQPSVLVGPVGGPHRIVQATLIAADWAHDVAVLRATPNPFGKGYGVKFLPLMVERPNTGRNLLLVSLHPSNPQEAYSLELPLEDHESGKLLKYQFSDGETQGTGRELIAVSQEVVAGQSGSPIVAADSDEVVGVALGRWLYPGLLSLAAIAGPKGSSPGAVLPVHYAIALLHDRGIRFGSVSGGSAAVESTSVVLAPASVAGAAKIEQTAAQNIPQAGGETGPPVPFSFVSTPYPPQALFGGEVALDAKVDARGRLDDFAVLHGEAPFLAPVLDAARTWSFEPAKLNGNAIDARVGILFQFPQSFQPPLAPREHTYQEPPERDAASDRAARPLFTTEPDYPLNTVVEGPVVIYATVDREGKVASTRVLSDLEPLTDTTLAAISHWRFAPARRGGADVESAVAIVVTFRRPAIR